MAAHPVIVSITSLPSRIGRIRPCLESLLAGACMPDKILLPLPPVSVRESAPYVVPDFLRDGTFGQGIVEVVPADRDWGPGTKLLGALRAIDQPSYLVLADDDVRYKPDFLRGLVSTQSRDHAASFSYFTHRIPGLAYGQGVDGISLWTPNVSGIEAFAEKHVHGTNLFYQDDLWISFYLRSKGIAIRSLQHQLGGGAIYEVEHHINALHRLEGGLSRYQLDRDGVKRLLKDVDMPVARRLRMGADAATLRSLEIAGWFAKNPHLLLARLRRVVSSH